MKQNRPKTLRHTKVAEAGVERVAVYEFQRLLVIDEGDCETCDIVNETAIVLALVGSRNKVWLRPEQVAHTKGAKGQGGGFTPAIVDGSDLGAPPNRVADRTRCAPGSRRVCSLSWRGT